MWLMLAIVVKLQSGYQKAIVSVEGFGLRTCHIASVIPYLLVSQLLVAVLLDLGHVCLDCVVPTTSTIE